MVLPLVCYAVLRTSAVQTYIAKKIASYLSNELNTKVSVGGLDISNFLDIVLEDVSMEDRKGENMFYVRRLVFDVGRLSFRHNYLLVDKLMFENAFVGLKKYPGSDTLNIQFLIDYFASPQEDTIKKDVWNIDCKAFELEESGLVYQDKNKVPLNGHKVDFNNMSFNSINLLVKDISFENDTLMAQLDRCSFSEKSGFRLDDLSAEVLYSPSNASLGNLSLKSPGTSLNIDADFSYGEFVNINDFFDNLRINIELEPSVVSLSDVGFWVHSLIGMDERIRLNGNVSGNFSNLRGRDFNLGFGKSTIFRGNFFLSGLPDFNETFINLFIDEFSTIKSDIDNLKLPGGKKVDAIQLPASLANIGILKYQGELTGFLNDFVAFGTFSTDLGNISSDLLLRQEPGKKKLSYKGKISTDGFMIGGLLDPKFRIGKVSLNASLEGSGVSIETLDVSLKGEIDTIQAFGYSYRDIYLAGDVSKKTFTGKMDINDSFLSLGFNGVVDLSSKIPDFAFQADLRRASLSKLNLFKRAPELENTLSAKLNIDFSASKLDNLNGKIELTNVRFSEFNKETQSISEFPLDYFLLENHGGEGGIHKLNIESDFFEAGLYGKINYSKFGQSMKWFLSHFLPLRFEALSTDSIGPAPADQDFSFWLALKNTSTLTDLFLPALGIAEGTLISGSYNSNRNVLEFEAGADYFSVAGNTFDECIVTASSDLDEMQCDFKSGKLDFGGGLGLDDIQLGAFLRNDSLEFSLDWFNISYAYLNKGEIKGVACFPSRNVIDASFLPSYVFINDTLWDIAPNNRILFDSVGISFTDLRFMHKDQYVSCSGTLSKFPGHYLTASFNQFNLSNIDWLTNQRKVDFDGMLSGSVTLGSLWQNPSVEADVLVKDFGFNHDKLGDAQIKSEWNNPLKAFEIDAKIIYYGNIGHNTPLIASGLFYPDNKEKSFDFDIGIENLKIAFLGRYLKGFTSNFRGLATGKLRLEGTPKKPELTGNVKLSKTIFRVDYLNTVYQFAHDVKIQKNSFSFDNLEINDSLGRKAFASGYISHSYFRDFALDITLKPTNFSILNTDFKHNELFYGKAAVSGLARIHGPANNLTMDVSAKSEKGTVLALPLSSQGTISETGFITFVKHDTLGQYFSQISQIKSESLGLVLNLDLQITPEAEIQIIFDSKIGDVIKGKGSGNIKMELNRQGEFKIYGDYIIEEGDYLFTLQNIINKRLKVEKGGVIRWAGDPYDADIDIKAIYKLRAPLYDLVSHVDTSAVYKRRIPVDCILGLSGKLFNPNVNFDIYLPSSDEGTREMVDRLISTDQEMNRQVFSLLLLNKFMSSSPLQYNTAFASGFSSTSGDFLSNQISNWLSQISSEVEIGVNIRPGDEINSSEMELALSTQFWDDRITVDGNVGTSSNAAYSGERASNIVGDVNVEVKITDRFRVKAFNRSNTYDLLNPSSPYTQGIGIFYRREFDKFSELLRRKRKIIEE